MTTHDPRFYHRPDRRNLRDGPAVPAYVHRVRMGDVMDRNGHPNVTGHLRNMPDIELDKTAVQEILKRRDIKLKEFAKTWINGPLPADLMADLADILEDEDYPPEKRAHQIVWQALKWGLENG